MQSYSGQFYNTNKHGIDLLKSFYTDEAFLRYCRILDDNPLGAQCDLNELSKNIIKGRDTDGLIDLNLLPEKIDTEGKVRIYFSAAQGSPLQNEENLEQYYLAVVIPSEYSVLYGQGQWRAICIAQRIAHYIDKKSVTGIGNCRIVHWERNKFVNNPDYEVLSLIIEVIGSNGYTRISR